MKGVVVSAWSVVLMGFCGRWTGDMGAIDKLIDRLINQSIGKSLRSCDVGGSGGRERIWFVAFFLDVMEISADARVRTESILFCEKHCLNS